MAAKCRVLGLTGFVRRVIGANARVVAVGSQEHVTLFMDYMKDLCSSRFFQTMLVEVAPSPVQMKPFVVVRSEQRVRCSCGAPCDWDSDADDEVSTTPESQVVCGV